MSCGVNIHAEVKPRMVVVSTSFVPFIGQSLPITGQPAIKDNDTAEGDHNIDSRPYLTVN